MRRRVSGHAAPNTASCASVGRSFRRVTSTAHQAPPSRSNNSMAGVSFNTITIASPVPPSSVSLRRSALAQRSSSTARPGAFPSIGSVCGARYSGAFQRTPLRSASSRHTKPRTPSGCFPTTAYEPAETLSKRVAAAERTHLAASVTKHSSYVRRSVDCFADSATWGRNTQSASYSRVLKVADKPTRLSRELTTVDSRSLDVDGTNDSRRPTSWSSFENLRGRRASSARTIDIRPVSIQPIHRRSPQPPLLSVSSQSKLKSEWVSDLRPLESSASESLSSVHRRKSSEYRALRRNASWSRGRRLLESRKNISTSSETFSQKAPDAFAKPSSQRREKETISPPVASILSPSIVTELNSGRLQSKLNSMIPLQASKPGSMHHSPSQSSVLSADARLTSALDSQYSKDLIQFSGSKSIESAVVTLTCPEATSLSSRLQDVPLVEIKASSPHQLTGKKQGQCIEVKSSVPLELQLVLSPPAAADSSDDKGSISARSILQQQEPKAGQLASPGTKPLQRIYSPLRSLEQQAIEPRTTTPLSPTSPPNAESYFSGRPTNITSNARSMDTIASPRTPSLSSTIPSFSRPRVADHKLKTAMPDWTASPASPNTAETQKPSILRSFDLELGQTNAAAQHSHLPFAPKNASNSNAFDRKLWKLHSKTTSECPRQNEADRSEQQAPNLMILSKNQHYKSAQHEEKKYEPVQQLPVLQKSQLPTVPPARRQSKSVISDYGQEKPTDSPATDFVRNEKVPFLIDAASLEEKASTTQASLTPAHHLHPSSTLTSPAMPKRPSFTVYGPKSSGVLNNNSESSQIYSTPGNTTERFRRYSLRQAMSIETISEVSEEVRPAGANDGLIATQSDLRSSSAAVSRSSSGFGENPKLAPLHQTPELPKVSSPISPPFYSFASDETSYYEIVARANQRASAPSPKFKEYVFPPAEETLPSEPCFLRSLSPHPADAKSRTTGEEKSLPLLSTVHIFGSFELTDETEPALMPGTENRIEPSVVNSSEPKNDETEVAVKSKSEEHGPVGARTERIRSLEFPSLESRGCERGLSQSGQADLGLRSLAPLDLSSVKAYSSKEGSSSMNILLQFDLLKLLESSSGIESAAKARPRDLLLGTKNYAKEVNTLPSTKNIRGHQLAKPGYRCYSSSSTSIDSEQSVS